MLIKNSLEEKFKKIFESLNLNNFEKAESLIFEILRDFPEQPTALTILGVIRFKNKEFHEGFSLINKSLALNPNQPFAYYNFSIACFEIKQFDKALQLINKAIEIEPKNINFMFHQASIFQALEDINSALCCYQNIIKINPSHLNSLNNIGLILKRLGKFSEALVFFNKCLDLKNNFTEALINKAFVFESMSKFDDAEKTFKLALDLHSNNPELYLNRSVFKKRLGNYLDAIDDVNHAIELNPQFSDAYSNRGNLYFHLNNYLQALEDFNLAIKLDDANYKALVNRGNLLQFLGNYAEAKKDITKAIHINEHYYRAKFDLSIVLLFEKNFNDAWPLYDYRLKLNERISEYSNPSIPLLTNSNILNKRVYIWGEQGIGDQILFSSLLNILNLKSNHFVLGIDSRLIPLYERSFKNIHFVLNNTIVNVKDFDFQLPIGSLGRILINSCNDLRNQSYKFLLADSNKTLLIKKKIPSKNKKICGLSWISKSEVSGNLKSLTLKSLAPILELDDLIFVDLQYGDTKTERDDLKKTLGIEIFKADEIDNFSDIDGLASLISACDIVITISNVTAHLAGSLGIKTYLLTSFSNGKIWYWHKDDTVSLWYPSIQIFRQQSIGEWDKPILELAQHLKDVIYE